VISPEGCAAILWNDRGMVQQAAEVLKPSAEDLLRFKIVEEIVPEPAGGAQLDWDKSARNLKTALVRNLKALVKLSPEALEKQRYEKFRQIGVFHGK